MAKQSRKHQVVKNHQGQGQMIEEVFDDNLLPDATEIEKLKNLDPNIVDWLKSRAECEQLFRQKVFDRKLDLVHKSERGERYISTMGLIFSFLIVLAGMGFSAFLIQEKHEILGSIFAGTVIIAIITLFLSKVNSPKNNKEN